MRGEYKRRLGPAQRCRLTVEKKEQDAGEAFFGDNTTVNVCYTMEAQSLREGLLSLSLATIKDFLRFIVATSQGIIDDG